ncbi:MAG: sensor histidine kinase [Jatrophihabitans sp.]|uniref:sensor histidine kinase n=1 Tax=Jatrophihabitans sp. TaxID=1932789 RepID=UPI00390F99F0
MVTRRAVSEWLAVPWRLDAAVAGLLLVLAEVALQQEARADVDGAGRLLLALLAAAATLPLAWRRRSPLLVFVVVATVLMGTGAVAKGLHLVAPSTQGPAAFIIAGVLAAFSCAAHGGRRAALAGAGVLAAGFAVVPVPELLADKSVDLGLYIALGLFLGIGILFHGREVRVVELEQWARFLEHDRDQQARAAVADERARIARELHDVVAHSVSLMVVQAGSTRHTLPPGAPGDVAEALGVIESSGRQALVELRRLLGILRTEQSPELGPAPGMAEVETLVDQVRLAGLAVRLTVEGERRPLPAGLDLSAYRIVQEALTNSIKHGHPSATDLTVRYRPQALELEVTDDGGPTGPPPDGTGHGLVGMRERVLLYGGTLEAGFCGSGFRVLASLPLSETGS